MSPRNPPPGPGLRPPGGALLVLKALYIAGEGLRTALVAFPRSSRYSGVDRKRNAQHKTREGGSSATMADAEVIQLLQKAPLFAGFSERELQNVAQIAKVRTFSTGETIVQEGDTAKVGFYLILSGRVEVRKGEKKLAELGPGQFFGEMALLVEGAPRSADVVALEDTECLVLTRWDLRSLIQTHPDMALKMLGEMARRLSTTHQALSE